MEMPSAVHNKNKTLQWLQNLEANLPLSNLDGITRLDLYAMPVSDEDLVHLHTLPNLEFLSLAKTAITNAGIRRLKPLLRLKELHLDYTALTDQCLPYLTGFRNLHTLDLKATAVSDQGLLQLEPLKKSLRMLYLMSTEIGDKGIQHLCFLKGLEGLILWDTPVTDLAIPILRQFNKLKFLDIQNTLISTEGRQELEACLPGCDLFF